jgi:hypothetical protein
MKPSPMALQDLPLTGRTAAPEVPLSRLSDFEALMRDEGLAVDLDRMRRDRLYAYERMARAQCSGNRRLRSAGVTLFVDYEGRRAGEPLH